MYPIPVHLRIVLHLKTFILMTDHFRLWQRPLSIFDSANLIIFHLNKNRWSGLDVEMFGNGCVQFWDYRFRIELTSGLSLIISILNRWRGTTDGPFESKCNFMLFGLNCQLRHHILSIRYDSYTMGYII